MTADTRTEARPPRTLPVGPLALAMLLLLLVALGSGLTTPWELSGGAEPEPSPVTTAPATVEPPPRPEMPEEAGDMSTTAKVVVGVGWLIVAAIAAYLLLRVVRRVGQAVLDRRTQRATVRTPGDDAPPGAVTVVPELRAGVEEAIGRLRGATTSTDAVIAAWLALEEAAEAAGTPRTAAQTPTELTLAVLDTTPVPPAAVTRLLHLYHLARFTDTPLTEHDVDAAEHSLHDLAHALAQPATDRGHTT